MLPGIAALDAWITRCRRTIAGEVGWLLIIALALIMQLSAVHVATAQPTEIDLYQFIENARAWLAGHPYPPGTHDPNAPHVILFFALFTSVSIQHALMLWLAVTYLSAFLTLWLILSEIPGATPQVAVGLAAVFFAAGAAADVPLTGNMVWPFWLAFTIAWRLARRGGSTASGALLGVLMTAKPFLTFWLLYFAVRRQWRALSAAIAAALATLVTAVLVTGPATWRAWIDVLHRITWYGERYNASIMGVLTRTGHDRTAIWAIAALVIAAGTTWAMARRLLEDSEEDRAWLLVLLAALLIAPLGWRYYLCFAWGPALGWLARTRASASAIGTLLVLWFCPVLHLENHGVAYRATVGSLVFYALLAAWLAVAESSRRSWTK